MLLMLMTSGCSVFGVRTAEEADYRTLQENGNFEIREYEPYVSAEVVLESEWPEFRERAFDLLFEYISGENQPSEKISMTAPVYLEMRDSQKIEMTSPVFIEGASEQRRMSFVLPSRYTLENAPRPNNTKVKLREQPTSRRLVKRFSGTLEPHRMKEEERELLEYAQAQELKIDVETLQFAGYDPPWTLPWFRRNEVMVEIE